ncbi:MAG: hypothetical protein JO142_13240 [Burkholderiales bacterium]|nr:hypothetical protein [Burkholderiales bacterium]
MMQLRKSLTLCAIASLMAGCATPVFQPVPADYNGPTAFLSDHCVSESSGMAQLYTAGYIDGKLIANSFGLSDKASYNKGFALTVDCQLRRVPAQPMKVTLVAGTMTPSLAQVFYYMAQGSYVDPFHVDVDFTPIANHNYVVTGTLSKAQSTVWIEDEDTHEVMTKKVSSDSK